MLDNYSLVWHPLKYGYDIEIMLINSVYKGYNGLSDWFENRVQFIFDRNLRIRLC